MDPAANPERAIILTYAPSKQRDGLRALLALDDALAQLLRTTTEPALGQMRLAWWRESLERLDHQPAPAEPVLTAIATHILPAGIKGAELAQIVHGWEVLVEEEHLGEAELARFGEGRGHLFQIAGRLFGANETAHLLSGGKGWALGDLAVHLQAAEEASEARKQAGVALAAAFSARWPKRARALGAMAHIARMNLALPEGEGPAIGAPKRVGRLLWHRLTGR